MTPATAAKKYFAFISYRHADNRQEGRQWATWLHQAIENYEVPSDLVGTTSEIGITIPERIFPIFRDEEELPASANLGSTISRALDSSSTLVVLCSPHATQSFYVASEIDYFKKNGGAERIIAAIIDGEPNTSWDDSKIKGGFTREQECFPEPLQFEYDANGNRTPERAEPIAADFRFKNNGRTEQGWTSPTALRLHLKRTTSLNAREIDQKVSEYEQQQKLMLLKVVSSILGVSLGELTKRDKAYQLELERKKARQLRRWLSAVITLAAAAIGLGLVALNKQKEAEFEREQALIKTRQAQTSESETLANQALEKTKQADFDNAIELALSGLPQSLTEPDRAWSILAESALAKAYTTDPLVFDRKLDANWNDADWLRKEPLHLEVSSDGSYLVASGGPLPMLVALPDKQITLQTDTTDLNGAYWSIAELSDDGQRVTASVKVNGSHIAYIWSTQDGRIYKKLSGYEPKSKSDTGFSSSDSGKEFEAEASTLPAELCDPQERQSNPDEPLNENQSRVLLYACDSFTGFLFPDSARDKFQVTNSINAHWIDGSNLVMTQIKGTNISEVWGFDSHEGVDQAAPLFRIKRAPHTHYTYLNSVELLAEVSADSRLRLWNINGSAIKPSARYTDYGPAPAELVSLLNEQDQASMNQSHAEFKKLGFDIAEISSNMGSNNRAPFETTPAESITESQLNEVSGLPPGFEPLFALALDRHGVFVADYSNAAIINQSGKTIWLHKSNETGIYEHSITASWGPAHQALFFSNSHGAWIYQLDGKLVQTVCQTTEDCAGDDPKATWLNNGQVAIKNSRQLLLIDLIRNQQIDLCTRSNSPQECVALGEFAVYGDKLAAVGTSIVDLATGVHLVNIQPSRYGMSPLKFNQEETAVLAMVLSGGGGLVFEAFEMPLRGQQLLEQARLRMENLYK